VFAQPFFYCGVFVRAADQLTDVLKQYVPSARVILQWLEAGDLSIPMPKTGVRLEEDGFVAPVDRVGHGLQRAFILSLLLKLTDLGFVDGE